MHPIVSDPHNHVPEVSAEDLWGDAEELPTEGHRSGTILPPRKPQPEDSSPAPTGNHQNGLRIESTPHRRQSDDPARQLDIHKIDGSVIRLDPEAPTQPQMPRQEVSHQPAFRKLHEAETPEWGKSRKPPIRWVLAIALGITSLIIAALIALPLINRSNATGYRPGQTDLAVDPNDALEDAALIEELLNLQSEAELRFKEFMTATTVDDLATIVRAPEEVMPLIRASSRTVLASKQWSPGEQAEWNVIQPNTEPFGLLSGTLPDYSDFSAYFVLSGDQLRIDWKATTGYGTATFDELAHNQGNPAEIRATIIPADYYSPVFPESDFRSYQLFAPDKAEAIWCYTCRKTPLEASLARLFRGGGILKPVMTPHKVTLRLEHGPKNALPNQWMIGEMLHEEWINP